MRPGDVFVLSPACRSEPAVVIAACRAGALGTLDLEYNDDAPAARRTIARIEKFCEKPFGVKLSVHQSGLLDDLLTDSPPSLGWMVLAGGDHPTLDAAVARIRDAGLKVFFEAIDAREMQRGTELGVDGLILKGHEAAGRVGDETSFILIQQWFRNVAPRLANPPPVWVQGGVGLHTAAACIAAGARGVVLDSQVLLAREAATSEATSKWLRNFDGSQTAVFGEALGERLRVAHWPRSPLAEALIAEASRIAEQPREADSRRAGWRSAVAAAIRESPIGLGPLAQDAAAAAPLADRYRTVGGIVEAFVQSVQRHLSAARRLRPLDEGSPLAASLGTSYPILQGPMTRVSDTAAFAHHVAREGGLPFLALALLRKAEVEALLGETRDRLGDLPWGAGILGFLPAEIRQEQTAAILETRPPFALIAGGRPDQARQFEDQGIPTFLHVPSPGLLRLFLREGARRFILEGRECGGHVGPRTSLVLWDAACEVILEHLGPSGSGDDLHVVLAGGIHDELSGAMVAATAAALAERGVRVGVLMGTAYLFTAEAVSGGAIVDRFQQEALRCQNTVLLETGPGHAIRCVPTPYCDWFQEEKRRLEADGRPMEEITRKLEWMNVGRLRVASKGVDRAAANDGAARLAQVSDGDQYSRGMYMIGQVSALRSDRTTIAELHAAVCAGATRRLEACAVMPRMDAPREAPCDVAVIGMSCFYPGAGGLQQFWSNILRRVYSVTEIPETHWDWSLYYNSDPLAKDKIVSKWGGFLGDVAFDPFRYGITPAAMKVIEPLQFLLLEAVRHALRDAGYAERPFARERTAAICGIGGGGSPMATLYGLRSCMPLLDRVPGMPVPTDDILAACAPLLPEWTEDSFPGFLMNVAVGRVANRFDLGGPNYAVDAACASSLAAVQLAIRELQSGTSDVALAMGADTVQTPFAYMAFSKTFALSRQGRCRPFDAEADGIVLAEGIGVVVLKRLADAERDGDRVLAVIRGVGSSSDGRDKGLTAPNASGQVRALERAYRQAGIAPARVGLVEAHGTGTVVGDRTEAESLGGFLRRSGAEPACCAVGSVKSMVGHSKCAAGIAGLIKTTMALHHKVLPPTLVERPNPHAGFDDGPLYLNTQSRPWIHGGAEPRCAGVSAFGFGGTNFHVVLEEYTGGFLDETPPALVDWEAELIVVRQPTRERLIETLQQIQQGLARGGRPRLVDLAAAIARANSNDSTHPVLAIVAGTLAEFRAKLPLAVQTLRGDDALKSDPRGVYFAVEPRREPAGLAFLFPGQGSQYPNMLAELAMAFPCVRTELDSAERVLAGRLPRPLGRFIYPPSAFDDVRRKLQADQLSRTDVAQPALAAASLGILALLGRMNVRPEYVAGHSSGEYAALHAAGCIGSADLIQLVHRRGALMSEVAGDGSGGMAAVEAGAEQVLAALGDIDGITLANLNSPTQTVISGGRAALDRAVERLGSARLRTQALPVSCAFHSPQVADAGRRLAEELACIGWSSAAAPVYSNVTGQPYPADPSAIVALLARHVTSPVRFIDEIEAMYAAGARLFLEVGPQGVLTGLVKQILGQRPHAALATDLKGRGGIVQLAHVLAQLLIRGVSVDASAWFGPRIAARFDLADLEKQTEHPPHSPSTWIVNSVRARPLHAPEPLLLGQRFSEDRWRQASASAAGDSPPMISRAPPSRTAPIAASTAPSPSSSGRPMLHENAPPPPSRASADGESPALLPMTPTLGPAGEAVDDISQVMCRFQDVMARFLDTQQAVLQDYFRTVRGEADFVLPVDVGGAAAAAEASPNALVPPAVLAAQPAPAETGRLDPVASLSVNATETSPDGVPMLDAASTDAVALPTRDELTRRLLDLVCKRTGYPHEMLDLDLDLEADLGVDSIKRVEILSTLAESLGGQESDLGGRLELEKLTVLRTLRGILDYLDQTVLAGASGEPKLPADASRGGQRPAVLPSSLAAASNGQATHDEAQGELQVQRALVELVAVPLAQDTLPVIPHGTVLITDERRGIAASVGRQLADYGQRVVYVHFGNDDVRQLDEDALACDLTSPVQVGRLVETIRERYGAVGGILHLSPLSASADGEQPQQRAMRDVKSLYLLARACEDDLQSAAKQGGAVLLAAMSLGGNLGFGDGALSSHYRAVHGGMAGFLKCVSQEWDDVLVRAVDLDLDSPAEELADLLLAELGDPGGPVEVGATRDRRVTWRPVAAPLEDEVDQPPSLGPRELDPGDTVLVTGGARGITAQVAIALAERWRPHLVLVGRTPLPEGDEPADVAELREQAEIKRALIERHRRAGETPAPAALETEYRRLLAEREVRATLAALDRSGATWEYHALDVRHAEAFGALLEDLNRRGGVAGVIHGAGVIEDRLLRDKTPESFDRVFQTKVDSALLLSERLDPERLKFCVLFSSLASRYGNRGQSDYAAANEVLSKLAIDLDRKWPGRICSIAWGPWSKIGMVAELAPHLERRGLKLIDPDEGPAYVLDEIARGRKGDCEVIVAGGAERLVRPRAQQPQQANVGQGLP